MSHHSKLETLYGERKQLWVTGYVQSRGPSALPINPRYESRLMHMVRRGICRTKHKVIRKRTRLSLKTRLPRSSVPVVAAVSVDVSHSSQQAGSVTIFTDRDRRSGSLAPLWHGARAQPGR